MHGVEGQIAGNDWVRSEAEGFSCLMSGVSVDLALIDSHENDDKCRIYSLYIGWSSVGPGDEHYVPRSAPWSSP